jgi:hypothetical protein
MIQSTETSAASGAAARDRQALLDDLVLRLTRKVCGEVGGCTRRCRRSGDCVKAERQKAVMEQRRRQQQAAVAAGGGERRLSTRAERRARIAGLFKGAPQRRKRRPQRAAPTDAQVSQSVS